MKIVSKLPYEVIRFILEILWDVEDHYYLTHSKISRFIYIKIKCLIGCLEEEVYRRNIEKRRRMGL